MRFLQPAQSLCKPPPPAALVTTPPAEEPPLPAPSPTAPCPCCPCPWPGVTAVPEPIPDDGPVDELLLLLLATAEPLSDVAAPPFGPSLFRSIVIVLFIAALIAAVTCLRSALLRFLDCGSVRPATVNANARTSSASAAADSSAKPANSAAAANWPARPAAEAATATTTAVASSSRVCSRSARLCRLFRSRRLVSVDQLTQLIHRSLEACRPTSTRFLG